MEGEKIFLSQPNYIEDINFGNNLLNNNINDFEKSLENYLKPNAKITCLSSGTAAMHIALLLAGVTKGDEVLCQTFTFVASVNPVLYIGATPIFIDSDIKNWNMCPILLEKAIKERIYKGKTPKAIIVVHSYGMPADIKKIAEIAKLYNIKLIEDAAEALGAESNGRKLGTYGDFGVLSFNNNKIITTFGGGALISKLNSDKKKAIFLATQAKDKAEYYKHSELGYNYRMSNVSALLGEKQLKDIAKYISKRRAIHDFYNKSFNNIEGISVFTESTNTDFSNHWLSCIQIDKRVLGFDKDVLRLEFKKSNIESRSVWKPLHKQQLYSNFISYENEVSNYLFETGLCLPSSANLSQDDLEKIKKCIENLL